MTMLESTSGASLEWVGVILGGTVDLSAYYNLMTML